MSDRFDLVPAPSVAPTPATTDAWRRAATSLRRAADDIALLTHDVAAYHRADVWQGAVATAFGEALEHWRSRLAPDRELGLGTELRAVADRLDARALAAELAVGGPVADLWLRPPAVGPT